MIQHLQTAHVPSAPTEYLVVAGVLVTLVFLTLWRETMATSTSMFFSRTMAALAFATSRITVVVFAATMLAHPSGPPFLYLLLNFVSLYLAARCMPAGIHDTRAASAEGAKSAPDDAHVAVEEAEWRAVKYQTAVFGLAAGLVYVVVPHDSWGGFSALGFIGAILLGATIRVSGALFMTARTFNSRAMLGT